MRNFFTFTVHQERSMHARENYSDSFFSQSDFGSPECATVVASCFEYSVACDCSVKVETN